MLSYEAPQFRGSRNLNLLFSGLFDDSRDVRTFSARRREGSMQVGEKLNRASTMLYGFSFRRVSVSNLKVSPELIPLFSQPARIGMLTVNYIQDRRDDPTDAHRGIYNTLDVGLASNIFGSQADFTHLIVQNATYHPFGFGSRYVLARSLTFGWLQPLRVGQTIPLPGELFGGGAPSHRGFPENQAGPRDPETGFPLGGNALLVNQIELRFPLVGDDLRGVLFWDAGNVYSDLSTISLRVPATSGLQLHGARHRLRLALQDPDGARAAGSRVQHQPADVFRIQRHARPAHRLLGPDAHSRLHQDDCSRSATSSFTSRWGRPSDERKLQERDSMPSTVSSVPPACLRARFRPRP